MKLYVVQLIACLSISYGIDRTDFLLYFALYSLWWLSYSLLSFRAAMLLLLVPLLAAPQLSDDYFRYLWDGQLLVSGINPYTYTPTEIIDNQIFTNDFLIELYPKLNSPLFHSVYPPLAQIFFALAASVGNLWAATILLRLLFLGAHLLCFLGVKRLIEKGVFAENIDYLYLCNPFIITELLINLHTEILFLPALVWAYYFRLTQKNSLSSFCFSLAIAAKLLPLLLLPIWALWQNTWRAAFRYGLSVAAFSALFFLPFFYAQNPAGMGKSLGLYFAYFEFNGSFYYIFTRLLPQIWGYDALYLYILKITLPLLVIAGITALAFRYRYSPHLAKASLYAYALYYATASTVHPWYLSGVLLFGLLSRQHWAQVWAWAVGLTYCTYAALPYQENYGLIFCEYALVLGAVWAMLPASQQKDRKPDEQDVSAS